MNYIICIHIISIILLNCSKWFYCFFNGLFWFWYWHQSRIILELIVDFDWWCSSWLKFDQRRISKCDMQKWLSGYLFTDLFECVYVVSGKGFLTVSVVDRRPSTVTLLAFIAVAVAATNKSARFLRASLGRWDWSTCSLGFLFLFFFSFEIHLEDGPMIHSLWMNRVGEHGRVE